MSLYSSSFYINEKKWFIRCDVFNNYGQGAIYSLPFAFDQFILFNDFYESKILILSNNNSKKNLSQKIKTFLVESLPYWNIDYELSATLNENFDRKSISSLIRNNYFNSVNDFIFYLMLVLTDNHIILKSSPTIFFQENASIIFIGHAYE
jgi:hypothetical protein